MRSTPNTPPGRSKLRANRGRAVAAIPNHDPPGGGPRTPAAGSGTPAVGSAAPAAVPRTPAIELSRVSVAYTGSAGEDVHALEGIDLNVDPGDFVCVVGPSGSGKTTILRLIAGFLAPTIGNVVFEGERVSAPGSERGVVFQSASLYPWLTVSQNVAFGLKMRGIGKAQRKRTVEHYLRLVSLWDFRDRHTYELSGGMRQRVAIARVLANDPHVLLMDEPFGALDALTREHLQEELLTIWRSTGKTVVFVTHSVEEAVYLSTRIVVLSPRPGRIIETVPSPFSRRQNGSTVRTVKADPDFIELRERVLNLIWNADAVQGPEAPL